MDLSVKLFTDCRDILDVEKLWNTQLVSVSKNPLLYSRIFCSFMSFYEQTRWKPLIFTFWSDEQLVGMAPLKLRKFFTINRVCSLDDGLYSDFVFADEYRNQCMDQLLDQIFNHLKCVSAEITLDNNSPNFDLLKKKCLEHKKLKVTEKPSFARAIVSLDGDYESFYASLKRLTKKHFRKMERRINGMGSWNVFCEEVTEDSIQKVFEIDQKSWKANWRQTNNTQEDDSLRIILEALNPNKEPTQLYKTEIWFLQINGCLVSYQVVLIYEGVATFVKTSYDQNFKRVSPGSFLINVVIREVFKKRLIKIDFLTDLPFTHVWRPSSEGRTQILVETNSLKFTIFRFTEKTVRGLQKLFGNKKV